MSRSSHEDIRLVQKLTVALVKCDDLRERPAPTDILGIKAALDAYEQLFEAFKSLSEMRICGRRPTPLKLKAPKSHSGGDYQSARLGADEWSHGRVKAEEPTRVGA